MTIEIVNFAHESPGHGTETFNGERYAAVFFARPWSRSSSIEKHTLLHMWNAASGRRETHLFAISRSQDLGGSMVRRARQAQWAARCGLAATAGAISTRPAIVEALCGREIKTRCRLSRGLAGKPNRAAAAAAEQNAAKGQLLDSRSRAPAAAGLGGHPRRLPGC